MKYKLFFLLIVCGLIIPITGCGVLAKWKQYFVKTKHTYLYVYNNSGQNISLKTGENNEKTIKMKSLSKFINPGESIKIKTDSQPMGIEYDFIRPSKEFITDTEKELEIYLQLEPDWKILVLWSDNFPASLVPPQPEGYPLKPKNLDKRR